MIDDKSKVMLISVQSLGMLGRGVIETMWRRKTTTTVVDQMNGLATELHQLPHYQHRQRQQDHHPNSSFQR